MIAAVIAVAALSSPPLSREQVAAAVAGDDAARYFIATAPLCMFIAQQSPTFSAFDDHMKVLLPAAAAAKHRNPSSTADLSAEKGGLCSSTYRGPAQVAIWSFLRPLLLKDETGCDFNSRSDYQVQAACACDGQVKCGHFGYSVDARFSPAEGIKLEVRHLKTAAIEDPL